MPTFEWLPFSKLFTPKAYKLEFSILFQNSVLKIDMNLVTTGHGDINAKEKTILIFTNQIMDKNNKAYGI